MAQTIMVGSIKKNGSSIQNEIEKALRKVLKKKNTHHWFWKNRCRDVGWSISKFFFDKIENVKKFLNSLNYFLSKKNISINSIKKKKLSFHSEIWCKKKEPIGM